MPIVLLLLIAACGGQRMPETRALTSGGNEVEINRVIEQALEADARSEPADSLYAPHAKVIADGKVRRAGPRFAGVGLRGLVAITNAQLTIRENVAWGDVEYRWTSSGSNQIRLGRASFVLTPARGVRGLGWWIVQAHSSSGS